MGTTVKHHPHQQGCKYNDDTEGNQNRRSCSGYPQSRQNQSAEKHPHLHVLYFLRS